MTIELSVMNVCLASAAAALLAALAYLIGNRRGYLKGVNTVQVEGAHCDVCEKASPKFIYFRGIVMCSGCYRAMTENKEMKCRFCEKPIERCECQ